MTEQGIFSGGEGVLLSSDKFWVVRPYRIFFHEYWMEVRYITDTFLDIDTFTISCAVRFSPPRNL